MNKILSGYGIGNQIEIEETIECLHGNLQPDIEELVCKYGGYLLHRTKMWYEKLFFFA